jgi:hypothetical protein
VQVGNALIVIEEYDKLDCPTRAMFRQLFENLHTANITAGRSAPNPLAAEAAAGCQLPCQASPCGSPGDQPHMAMVSGCRPVILLESNTGYTQLHQMLEDVGGKRSKVTVLCDGASKAIERC